MNIVLNGAGSWWLTDFLRVLMKLIPQVGHGILFDDYPLVNVYIAMENLYFSWVNQLYRCAIFNSYVANYQRLS